VVRTCSTHGREEKYIQYLIGKPKHRWEDNWFYRNRMGRCGLDASGSRQGPVVGSCENGNEHLGSIKGRVFLDWLSGSQEGLFSM
jgi:hypothetical protein